jgi:hypothetical protein
MRATRCPCSAFKQQAPGAYSCPRHRPPLLPGTILTLPAYQVEEETACPAVRNRWGQRRAVQRRRRRGRARRAPPTPPRCRGFAPERLCPLLPDPEQFGFQDVVPVPQCVCPAAAPSRAGQGAGGGSSDRSPRSAARAGPAAGRRRGPSGAAAVAPTACAAAPSRCGLPAPRRGRECRVPAGSSGRCRPGDCGWSGLWGRRRAARNRVGGGGRAETGTGTIPPRPASAWRSGMVCGRPGEGLVVTVSWVWEGL